MARKEALQAGAHPPSPAMPSSPLSKNLALSRDALNKLAGTLGLPGIDCFLFQYDYVPFNSWI